MSPQDAQNPGKSKAPKVLRIGVVQGGKIIEETRLKKRETVSVGTSDKCTFSVQSPHLPKQMDVFELVGDKYFVRFDDKMDGRVQTGKAAVRSFTELRADPKTAKKGELWSVEITNDSRGKVIFGDVTLLFQFVEPILAPAKLELPPEARGSLLTRIDLQFSSILVVVATCCISVVAYASNQPYVEPTSIEQISERYQKLIMPDRVPEPPRVEDQAAGEEKKEEEKKPEEKKAEDKKVAKKGKDSGEKKEVSAEEAARARKEAITKQVAGKGLLGVIGVKGKDGALSDVFAEGGGVEGDIGNAMSGIQGIDIAESGGQAATRGGGAGESASIGDIATQGGGSVSTGTKVEAKVSGRVDAEAPAVDGDLSPDAIQRAMRKYISGVKDCYERSLKRDPKLAGKVVVGFEISTAGAVSEVEFPTDNVGSTEMRGCIKTRARSWRFPRPEGGPVYVEFPFVFEPSSN